MIGRRAVARVVAGPVREETLRPLDVRAGAGAQHSSSAGGGCTTVLPGGESCIYGPNRLWDRCFQWLRLPSLLLRNRAFRDPLSTRAGCMALDRRWVVRVGVAQIARAGTEAGCGIASTVGGKRRHRSTTPTSSMPIFISWRRACAPGAGGRRADIRLRAGHRPACPGPPAPPSRFAAVGAQPRSGSWVSPSGYRMRWPFAS